MSSRTLFFLLFWLALALVLDFYAYQTVRAATQGFSARVQRGIAIAFWAMPVMVGALLIYYVRNMMAAGPTQGRALAAGIFFAHFVFVLMLALFTGVDDLRRLLFAFLRFVGVKTDSQTLAGLPVTRSAFLSRAALAVAAVPALGMVYGVVAGGHRYQIRRRKITLPNLPDAFEGLRIVQISDIHSGSFFSKAGVEKGIQAILAQKPDLILFTGDLVNNVATEIEPWLSHFSRLKAPMGVYSVFGNHDYGDYVAWDSPQEKRANLQRLAGHHATMGWRLLLDENVMLERNGEQIALIGIQNWGVRANFPKYGNLAKASRGAEAAPVKILMSHDPSHWRAQVIPEFSSIDLMLSGHTHGMQFGIDNEVLKWSPVQYVYKEWGGHYQEGAQQLYVNRGFGFIGYPGRFGIWPEITVLELAKT